MDPEIGFGVIKNLVIEQNKQLLTALKNTYTKRLPTYDKLCELYIKPEYFLIIMQKSVKKNG
jgi:hypothetical protein